MPRGAGELLPCISETELTRARLPPVRVRYPLLMKICTGELKAGASCTVVTDKSHGAYIEIQGG